MKLQTIFSKIKDVLLADSWTDSLIQMLHNLPIPYWLTCSVITYIVFFQIYPEGYDTNNYLNLSNQISTPITFGYSLFIYWHLSNFSSIFPMQNKTTIAPFFHNISLFASKIFTSIKVAFRILFVLFMLLLVLLGLGEDSGVYIAIRGVLLIYGVFIMPIIVIIKIGKLAILTYRIRKENFEINLFDLSFYYSLSRNTQKIALYIIPYSVGIALYAIPGIIAPPPNTSVVISSLFIISFSLGLSAFIFIFPVYWVRGRIIETKRNLLSQIGSKIRDIYALQDSFANQNDFINANALQSYLESLISRTEHIKKISEVPWETRTFRDFLTIFLIPIILWLMQFYLEKWLGK